MIQSSRPPSPAMNPLSLGPPKGGSPPAWLWVLPVSSALMLRASLGSAPFPTRDHLAYLPVARGALDASLFPGDAILHAVGRQMPLWALSIGVGDAASELPKILPWLTLGLTLALTVGVFQLMRAVKVDGALLPLVLLVGLFGPARRLLPRESEAALGTDFSPVGLAIVLVLWSYLQFIRGRSFAAGVLLGLAMLSHPVAGLHGAAVLSIAVLVAADARWSRLAIIIAAAFVIGAPGGVLPLLGNLASELGLADVYLYRLPDQYGMERLPRRAAMATTLLLTAGITGTALLAHGSRSQTARALSALLVGHALLAASAVVAYRHPLPHGWSGSAVPYVLDLTLSFPLLPILAAIAAFAALEACLQQHGQFRTEPVLAWLALGGAMATLVAATPARTPIVVMAGLGFGALGAIRLGRSRGSAAALAVIVVLSLGLGTLATSKRSSARVRPPMPAEEADLYAWARQATPPSALFIVPPSSGAFRYHTGRGIYVDYALFPATSPAAARVWRSRLQEIAGPERRALESPRWKRLFMFDREYANRNTPARILRLLRQTGAAYFVWDATGLDIPPFLPGSRPPDPALSEVFRNPRYVVYARTGAASAER